MTHNARTITIADPRTFDGDPYDVGGRGVAQVKGLIDEALRSLPAARLMARNAELTRRLDRDEPPEARQWDSTVEGRRWYDVEKQLEDLSKQLGLLQRAAAFDPKAKD